MLLKILFGLCIVLQIIFVPLFLKAQWPGICRKSLFFKMICATSFLSMGVLSMSMANNKSTYAVMMLVGLVFGWLGDLFLHLNNSAKAFAMGFSSFLIGHIVYIAAYVKALPKLNSEYSHLNLIEIAIGVGIFVVGFILAVKFKVDFSTRILKIAVIIYSALLVAMFTKASALGLSFWLSGGKLGVVAFLMLSVGSLCFMMSDATLGIIMFGGQKRNKPLKVFNIATYFIAQSLLASSILFIKA